MRSEPLLEKPVWQEQMEKSQTTWRLGGSSEGLWLLSLVPAEAIGRSEQKTDLLSLMS